jgi:hypothetical protein
MKWVHVVAGTNHAFDTGPRPAIPIKLPAGKIPSELN